MPRSRTEARRSPRRSLLPLLSAALAAAAEGGEVSLSPFTEEALARGVDWPHALAPGAGRGIALVDLDEDGDADLVLLDRAGSGGLVGVFENAGGVFLDLSATSGIPLLPAATGVFPADYDADGDLDLFIGRWQAPNVLLRQETPFTFVDVTAAAGLGDAGRASGCAWSDFDGDGDLDLYVANVTDQPTADANRFWRNEGDGTFTDVGVTLDLAFRELTWKVCFFDADRDGDPDLYVSNDKCVLEGDATNYLYENVGGAFVDVSAGSGADVCIDSMGVAIGDFDNNLFLDLYPTNTPEGNPLLLARGDGTYVDLSGPTGTASYQVGWGALFFDFDNDGLEDLYVCQQMAPNRLYHNSTTWPLLDLAQPLHVYANGGSGHCVAAADVDLDGDLDLVTQQNGDRVRLFINHEGEERSWVRFRVVGRGANTHAIGARIDLRFGTERRTREVMAGENFKSQNELPRHFGLGAANEVDEVVVSWPWGGRRRLRHVPARRVWSVYPTERLGDADGDGTVGPWDLAFLVRCFDPNGPTPLAPGFEMMDLDGDFDVDRDDVGLFLSRYEGPPSDCNGNGRADVLDILYDASLDWNMDAIPDECQGG